MARPSVAQGGLATLRRALHAAGRPESVPILLRFFKTGVGEYGEGDQFFGLKVPETRRLARLGETLPLGPVTTLLRSRWHEERLAALFILVRRFQQGDGETQEAVVRLYLREARAVNNWDLVDSSAPYILGIWLLARDRSMLDQLAASANLWERRIAIVATLAFIRAGDLACTFRISEKLLNDRHDLMHKAAGWMLREAGKRDATALRRFLDEHAPAMPRTMLRYAIERFSPEVRATYLKLPRRR